MNQPQTPLAQDGEESAGATGGAAIRGSVARMGGYGVAVMLSLITIPFVIRYLGPEDFGRLVLVQSLILMIGGIADFGLTNFGTREYVLIDALSKRREMLSSIMSMRVIVTALGVIAAMIFAVLANWEPVLLYGTLVTGVGLLVLMVQQTLTIPLQARVRFGRISILEVVRNGVVAALTFAVIFVGGTLTGMYFVPLGAALVAVIATLFLIDRRDVSFPRVHLEYVRRTYRHLLPYAAATAIGVFYFRVSLLVLGSIGSPFEVGVFGAAFRVVENAALLPSIVIATAFPLLVKGASVGGGHLERSAQKVLDAAVVTGAFTTVLLITTAPWVIRILAGETLHASVGVLTVLSLAIPATFLLTALGFTLLAAAAYRLLLIANGVGLVIALAFSLLLVVPYGAMGAAIASVIAEFGLMIALLIALRIASPGTTMSWRLLPQVGALVAICSCARFLPVPSVVQSAIAIAVFVSVSLGLGLVPAEVRQIFRIPELSRFRRP